MEETTTTTTTVTSSTTVITCNTSYLLSVPGILKIAEVILGLLCWALIASVGGTAFSRPHQFVMFVAVTSWILTLLNIRVQSVTTRSIEISWDPLPVEVDEYRVEYNPKMDFKEKHDLQILQLKGSNTTTANITGKTLAYDNK